MREAAESFGIAGGMIHTSGRKYVSQEVALTALRARVQLFRRECFEQVGVIRSLPLGGIDPGEFAARMKGWETRTFPEHRVFEHRLTGSATASH